MNIFRASQIGDDWDEVREELQLAFQMSRTAAQNEESFVFVVHHDDLLGRRGAGNAMVATGLLSAARTAAIEGSRKGWTANVIAYDDETDPDLVDVWAKRLGEDSPGVTGELIRLGPSHLGKALP
ncbi:MAG TPA: hypothetical protein VE569_13775 [Acidimicrobiia bacterium]|jgi:hypothetical protein|nr:hypothetical protein [Acidimicrobiia bacterium]